MSDAVHGLAAGVFRHYKGGLYRVLFEGLFSFATTPNQYGMIDSAAYVLDGKPCVVYVSITNGHIFVRPLEEFFGNVTLDYEDGPIVVPRFKPEQPG